MRLEWGIVSLTLLVAFGSSYLYLPEFLKTQRQVDRLLTQPTLLLMELDISYQAHTRRPRNADPALALESWHITNESGYTHLRYNARSESMLGILDLPSLHTVDAAVLYDQLVYNRIWNLPQEPHACDQAKHLTCYRVHVRTQRGNDAAHERLLSFDDDVLRQTSNREFRIKLDDHRSTQSQLSAALMLQARQPRIPHYGQLLTAFKAFGDHGIQEGVASARARVLGMKRS